MASVASTIAPAPGGLKTASLVFTVSGVSFLNSYFSGALTVSLPTIQQDLQISNANLQWSVSLYSLVLGAFLLPAGRFADVYTPRRLFLSGTAFYLLLSIAVAVSPNWISFTVFCTLLGLGAAANTPAGVGILGSYFEPGESKNRAFAALGAGQPLGFVTGLVIGAILSGTKGPGWRASFGIQAGLAGLFLVSGYFSIPSSFPPQASDLVPLTRLDEEGRPTEVKPNMVLPSENRRIDWIGMALSVFGLVLLTFALTDATAETRGWKTPFLPPMIPISFALLAGFFYWERHLEKRSAAYYALDAHEAGTKPPPPPLLSPAIWTAPFLGWIMAIVFCAWASFNTASYYINLILQLVLKVSPIKSALYFLPMIIFGTLLNLLPGFLLGRISGQVLIVLSMALSLIGPILMATMRTEAIYWEFVFPIMATLPAPDLMYAISAVQISKSVPRSQQASSGALFNVITRLATATSLGVISTIANGVSKSYLATHLDAGLTLESPEVLMAGYRVAAWVCTALAGLGLVLSFVGLRNMGIVGETSHDVSA